MLETGMASSIVANAIRDGKKIIEINPEPIIEIGNTF